MYRMYDLIEKKKQTAPDPRARLAFFAPHLDVDLMNERQPDKLLFSKDRACISNS